MVNKLAQPLGVIILLGSQTSLAIRATAPCVQDEILFTIVYSFEAKPSDLFSGKPKTLNKPLYNHPLDETAKNLLSKRDSLLSTQYQNPPAISKSQDGIEYFVWNQVLQTELGKNSPLPRTHKSMEEFYGKLTSCSSIAYVEPNYSGNLSAAPDDPYYILSHREIFISLMVAKQLGIL